MDEPDHFDLSPLLTCTVNEKHFVVEFIVGFAVAAKKTVIDPVLPAPHSAHVGIFPLKLGNQGAGSKDEAAHGRILKPFLDGFNLYPVLLQNVIDHKHFHLPAADSADFGDDQYIKFFAFGRG